MNDKMNNNRLLLSGFADESSFDKTIDQQFSAFAALGLNFLSLRFIDVGHGIKNAMNLSESEVDGVVEKLNEYGLAISSLGSPLGKVKLLDVDDSTKNSYKPFDQYLESEVNRACELANKLGTRLIRGFSFYHPKGTRPQTHLPLAIDQIGAIASRCAESGLVFGLEVEANLVGQNGQILSEIHRAINCSNLVLIFDGGNLVTQGYSSDEIFEQYQLMKPGLGWIHIKDYRRPPDFKKSDHVDEEALKHYVPAEFGDTDYRSILKDLVDFLPELTSKMSRLGVPGVFADLEPHVRGGGQFGGFSGPDGFGVALRSFCRLCDDARIEYRLRSFDDVLASRGF